MYRLRNYRLSQAILRRFRAMGSFWAFLTHFGGVFEVVFWPDLGGHFGWLSRTVLVLRFPSFLIAGFSDSKSWVSRTTQKLFFNRFAEKTFLRSSLTPNFLRQGDWLWEKKQKCIWFTDSEIRSVGSDTTVRVCKCLQLDASHDSNLLMSKNEFQRGQYGKESFWIVEDHDLCRDIVCDLRSWFQALDPP